MYQIMNLNHFLTQQERKVVFSDHNMVIMCEFHGYNGPYGWIKRVVPHDLLSKGLLILIRRNDLAQN